MFNAEYRKVLNDELPLSLRHLKFRHCLEWYCFLTRQSFRDTYQRFGREFGFAEGKQPDSSQLSAAAELLMRERAKFLQKLRAFDQSRVESKAQGRWQPRKAELKELYAPDWLETGSEKQG
jgi:hypothetical protein